MSFTGTFTNGGIPKNPTFDTLVVRTALQLNSGAVFDLYNTADQTTNYERLRVLFTSNVAQIAAGSGGSGTIRNIRIGTTSAGADTPARYLEIAAAGSASTGILAHTILGTSSGTQTAFAIGGSINQSGTAGYTALDINPTETATGSGTKLLQRWAVGGTAQALISNTGATWALSFNSIAGFGFTTSVGGSTDVVLARDAADTLALRRSTNAQTFRVYNTYTDASNGEWLAQSVGTAVGGNGFRFGTYANGTGGTRNLGFVVGGAVRWGINNNGHFLADADNTYDIGTSGANRPRSMYLGSGIVAGGVISTTNYISSLYSIITDGATAPSATVGQAKIYVDSADGDLKIIFGDGTVKTIVTDT